MVLKAWRAMCFALLLAASTAGAQQPTGNGVAAPAAADTSTPSRDTGKEIHWPSADQLSRRIVEPGLPDFGKLNANVWRSGQPTQRGYAKLAEMHVKTIVNLRAEFPEEKDRIPAGVQYFQIPITDQTPPTDEQAKQFLQIVTNPNNWPVLVHCAHGEGRTGVMCALVRYALDGWEDKRIMQEVGNFRISLLGLMKTRMCDSQRKFIQHWEENNKPGACLAWIGSPQPTQP
jgi:protein tyrosine phosphatase (PTP) superfamily phosphohydrolase (DUF442 family)